MSAASLAREGSYRAREGSHRARRRAVLLAATAAVAALSLSACGSEGTAGGSGDTKFITGDNGVDTVAKGKRDKAPELSGRTLDGKELSTADFRGKVLVVNVWGSWCAPCRAEAKNLQRVAEKYADQGVQFVGINTRDTSTTAALNFEKEFGVTYPSLYDPTGKQMLRFGKGTLNPQLIPSTLVIDREGRIAARALMALDEETLTGMIKPVLAEK